MHECRFGSVKRKRHIGQEPQSKLWLSQSLFVEQDYIERVKSVG
jgi:hypothetical protein